MQWVTNRKRRYKMGGFLNEARRGSRAPAWCITDGSQYFGYKNNGSDTLLSATKRGLPSGVMLYKSEREAEHDLEYMKDRNHWPLFMHKAKVKKVR